MNSPCPKCRDVELTAPADRADRTGRTGRFVRCPKCRGTWLPSDSARLEAVASLLDSNSTVRPTEGMDDRTGLCPKGHGILIRARVETAAPFFLERCGVCHGIWMDQGEWSELAQSHLLEHLDDLWDPAFRFRERHETEQVATELAADLGGPLLQRIEELATAFRELSPRVRAAALAHLHARLEEP